MHTASRLPLVDLARRCVLVLVSLFFVLLAALAAHAAGTHALTMAAGSRAKWRTSPRRPCGARAAA
jgi:hypothetical protein